MKTLAFDNLIGLILTNNSFTVLENLDALVNKVKQRLNFFLNEWFLNITVGIAYFQQIFEKPINPSLIATIIKTDLSKESDITSIDDLNVTFNEIERTFSYSIKINTIYGAAVIDQQTIGSS